MLNYLVNLIVYVYGRDFSVKTKFLMCGDIHGVRSNKHILILSFVVNPPFFCDELICLSIRLRKKTQIFV